MIRFLTTSALALMLTGGVAFAQSTEADPAGAADASAGNLDPQDRQGRGAPFDFAENDSFTEDDWSQSGMPGDTFSAWDEDQDGTLSEEEFSRGMYSSYDSQGAGSWSQDDYQRYSDVHGGGSGDMNRSNATGAAGSNSGMGSGSGSTQ